MLDKGEARQAGWICGLGMREVELERFKAQLARTDAWMDQAVYRLYSLSEEEIAAVEGTR